MQLPDKAKRHELCDHDAGDERHSRLEPMLDAKVFSACQASLVGVNRVTVQVGKSKSGECETRTRFAALDVLDLHGIREGSSA